MIKKNFKNKKKIKKLYKLKMKNKFRNQKSHYKMINKNIINQSMRKIIKMISFKIYYKKLKNIKLWNKTYKNLKKKLKILILKMINQTNKLLHYKKIRNNSNLKKNK